MAVPNQNNQPKKMGKKARTSRKGKSNKASSSASSAPPRQLMAGRIPKGSMRISGNGDTWRVTGSEIIDKVRCTKSPLQEVFQVNPLQNELFPKLSGFALQFQRYRFTKIRLVYSSACPATRSGALGMAISTQYEDQADLPNDFVSMGAYEYASVGTVSNSFATPVWTPRDQERYNMPSASSLGADQTYKIYQASLLFLSGEADPADDLANAGYISIEYDVDLYGWRPTVNRMISLAPRQAIKFSGTGVTPIASTLLPLTGPRGPTDHSSIKERVGSWFVDKVSAVLPGVLSADDPLGSIINSVKPGLSYVAKYLIPLSAVLSSTDAWSDDETVINVSKPKKERKLSTVAPRDTINGLYNPLYVDPEPGWVAMDEKEQTSRTHKQLCRASMPLAAGDFTIVITALRNDGTSVNLFEGPVLGLGTGSYNYVNSLSFEMPADASSLYWSVIPAAGESRNLVLTTNPGPYIAMVVNSARLAD